jgi:glyoxylase-like metal-dependent hydrolase (beta-lactamase superfamily II)
MNRVLTFAVLSLIAAAPQAMAQGAKPNDLVKQAVAAEGGADKLRALKRVSIQANATQWEPEQSEVAGGPPRPLGHATEMIRWDFDKGMERGDYNHTMLYPFPGQEKYSEIISPKMGAVSDDKGQRPMSAARLAFSWREEERASPVLLLKALDAPQSVTAMPPQKIGKDSLPAVAFMDGGTKFIILFDRKTHLPAMIRTIEDDDVHGDGHYDLALADWKDVGGVKMAFALHYTFNGLDKLKVDYTEVTPNPAIADDAFAVSDPVRQAAKPPAAGDLPWQSMLVSQNFGRWDDIQAEKNIAEGPAMHINEIAPTILQVGNRSHNSLIVAMPSYLVVFDAPANDAYAKWTIEQAKQRFPGRPIKYLVLTHHHMDHIGGARTFVAEGATVIVGKPDKAHLLLDFAAQHKMHPDTLQLHPMKAKVEEVADRMTLKDGKQSIDIIRIPNLHVEGMLIGYVQPEKLVWVTDIYSPGRDKAKTPANADFYATIQKLGLKPEWYAGGHGSSGKAADLDAIMAAAK